MFVSGSYSSPAALAELVTAGLSSLAHSRKLINVCRMNVEYSTHKSTPLFARVLHKQEIVHQALWVYAQHQRNSQAHSGHSGAAE